MIEKAISRLGTLTIGKHRYKILQLLDHISESEHSWFSSESICLASCENDSESSSISRLITNHFDTLVKLLLSAYSMRDSSVCRMLCVIIERLVFHCFDDVAWKSADTIKRLFDNRLQLVVLKLALQSSSSMQSQCFNILSLALRSNQTSPKKALEKFCIAGKYLMVDKHCWILRLEILVFVVLQYHRWNRPIIFLLFVYVY